MSGMKIFVFSFSFVFSFHFKKYTGLPSVLILSLLLFFS